MAETEKSLVGSRFNIVSGPSSDQLDMISSFLQSGHVAPQTVTFHLSDDVDSSSEDVRVATEHPNADDYHRQAAVAVRITKLDSEHTPNRAGVVASSTYAFEAEVHAEAHIAHIKLTRWTILKGVYSASTSKGYVEILA